MGMGWGMGYINPPPFCSLPPFFSSSLHGGLGGLISNFSYPFRMCGVVSRISKALDTINMCVCGGGGFRCRCCVPRNYYVRFWFLMMMMVVVIIIITYTEPKVPESMSAQEE